MYIKNTNKLKDSLFIGLLTLSLCTTLTACDSNNTQQEVAIAVNTPTTEVKATAPSAGNTSIIGKITTINNTTITLQLAETLAPMAPEDGQSSDMPSENPRGGDGQSAGEPPQSPRGDVQPDDQSTPPTREGNMTLPSDENEPPLLDGDRSRERMDRATRSIPTADLTFSEETIDIFLSQSIAITMGEQTMSVAQLTTDMILQVHYTDEEKTEVKSIIVLE